MSLSASSLWRSSHTEVMSTWSLRCRPEEKGQPQPNPAAFVLKLDEFISSTRKKCKHEESVNRWEKIPVGGDYVRVY